MSTNCAAASLALPEKNSTAPPRLGGWNTRLVEEGEPGVPVLAGSAPSSAADQTVRGFSRAASMPSGEA